jgi:hypothetical protein
MERKLVKVFDAFEKIIQEIEIVSSIRPAEEISEHRCSGLKAIDEWLLGKTIASKHFC